jgi:hypothetical protein
MELTGQQVEKLLKGNYAFSLWSLSMLVTRLKGVYANDPSPEILGSCTGELNAFVRKFGKIMSNDYAIIEKL